MKTLIFRIIAFNLVIYCFSLTNKTYSQYDSIFRFNQSVSILEDSSRIEAPEYLTNISFNTFYWGQNNEGLTPTEVLYIESFNRIYILGSRGISVFNPETMENETFIPLCEYGQYNKFDMAQMENKFGWKQMAYDGDHYLYCFTFNNKISIINLQNNTVFDECELVQLNTIDRIERIILKYDQINNKVFLILSQSSFSFMTSHCFRFNVQYFHNYYYTYTNKKFFDFEISQSDTYLFASYELIENNEFKYYYRVLDFNFQPVSTIAAFNPSTRYGHIEYVYNPGININKALCFPAQSEGSSHSALCYNGETYIKSTINLMGYHKNIQATSYVPSDQKIYFGYNDASFEGIGTLNVINNMIHDLSINTNLDEAICDICVTPSRIFLAKWNRILITDKNSTQNIISLDFFDDGILSLAESSNNVFAVNHENCSMEILDYNGILINNKRLGGSCLQGTYNSNSNKIFMYNPGIADFQQSLLIKNLNDQATNYIHISEFGFGYISGVVSDESRNLVYMSIASSPTQYSEIKIIDAETNLIEPNSFPLPSNVVCRKIFLANDKLYCVLEYYSSENDHYSRIYIIDLASPSLTYLLSPSQPKLNDQLMAWFELDENGNVIIALNDYNNPNNGRIIIVSNSNNSISNTYAVLDPNHISYDKLHKKLFFTKFTFSPVFGIIDLINQSVFYNYLGNYCSYLIKPLYLESQRELCIIGHEVKDYTKDTKFLWMDPVSLQVQDEYTSNTTAISCNYNYINGEIYTFYPKGSSNKQQLGIVPRSSHINYLVPLLNAQRLLPENNYTFNQIYYDENYNYLFIPNQFFSDFYKINLPNDYLTILPGQGHELWNWISFPRLERQNNDPNNNNPVPAQPILENIDPFPTSLTMTNMPLQSFTEKSISFNSSTGWSGDLEVVQSTLGYKLNTSNIVNSYLPMEGTQLNPSYPMTIYKGYTNWVGYYPTWSQNPMDALADILDELTIIRHHDWACVKDWYYWDGNQIPVWVCSRTKPLKYGDMLELEADADVTFQWGGSTSGYHDLPHSVYYSYEEKLDYTPIFIELDTTVNPSEIGAFVADSCVGAAVVEEGDSLVMIRAYMPDDTSGTIAFQEYYGPTKKVGEKIDKYYVTNTVNHIKERRTIHSKENNKFYFVSLKNECIDQLHDPQIMLNIIPNPCTGNCKIEYYVPSPTDVTIEVFDIYGRNLESFLYEIKSAGQYFFTESSLTSAQYPAGIYLIKLTACGKSISKKIIID